MNKIVIDNKKNSADISSKKIKKCEDIYCKQYVKKVQQLSKEIIKIMMEKVKFDNLDKNTKDDLKKKIKNITDNLKSKEFINNSKELCKNAFCNPKCKGTIFQNGKFPEEIIKKYSKVKDGDIIIKTLKLLRNKIFNGKKTVIKDDFYIEFKQKNKIQKEGAISGCAIAPLN